MKIIASKYLTELQKKSVYHLWNEEYPQNLCYNTMQEFEEYLMGLSEKKHYLLINPEEVVVAWAFTFKRDNEKWFAIIVNSLVQDKGYGSLLLNEIKKAETPLVGWVVDHELYSKSNGDKYRSPLVFYRKHQFNILANSRLETSKISAVKIEWKKNRGG